MKSGTKVLIVALVVMMLALAIAYASTTDTLFIAPLFSEYSVLVICFFVLAVFPSIVFSDEQEAKRIMEINKIAASLIIFFIFHLL